MRLYTRTGDRGMTSLLNEANVSKTDERIELLGEIDELSSFLGLAKIVLEKEEAEKLSQIQQLLMTIMAGVADAGGETYRLQEEHIRNMENEIDHVQELYGNKWEFVLYGGCESAARLDVARAVARRVERSFYKVSEKYTVDPLALQYINRLSDYLYILARYYFKKNEKSC